jgi:malonate transporter and related proteins
MGLVQGRGRIGEATLAGVAGGFGNAGYMGPGLALAALGPEAAVPVALVFCFDALLIFVLVPLLMTFSKAGNIRVGRAQQLPALCVLLATAGWCGVRLMQLFLKLGKSWLIILISSRH